MITELVRYSDIHCIFVLKFTKIESKLCFLREKDTAKVFLQFVENKKDLLKTVLMIVAKDCFPHKRIMDM